MSFSKPQHHRKPRFKDWLIDVLNNNLVEDARWVDQNRTTAFIRWPHKSRGTWRLETDARLFEMWAIVSGKYRRGQDPPNPKSWKCNFRMNLNICKNIKELTGRRVTKGVNACRYFQFLDKGFQNGTAAFSDGAFYNMHGSIQAPPNIVNCLFPDFDSLDNQNANQFFEKKLCHFPYPLEQTSSLMLPINDLDTAQLSGMADSLPDTFDFNQCI